MAAKFGVFVPQGWRMDLVEIDDPVAQYEAMTNVAKKADKGGWDSIWVFDHFHTVPEPTMETTFECWTISATLARDTTNVHIGQMVGYNGYRNPALYAKIASTVDVTSHGRLYVGIVTSWSRLDKNLDAIIELATYPSDSRHSLYGSDPSRQGARGAPGRAGRQGGVQALQHRPPHQRGERRGAHDAHPGLSNCSHDTTTASEGIRNCVEC